MIKEKINKINESLKDIIKIVMDESGGKIELDEAKELIRPHFNPDPDKLYENALTAKTRYIIYSFKDKKGVRKCVANNSGTYMDIESLDLDSINNLDEMLEAEKQVRLKCNGMLRFLSKIRGKIKEIDGQICFPEIEDLHVEEA